MGKIIFVGIEMINVINNIGCWPPKREKYPILEKIRLI